VHQRHFLLAGQKGHIAVLDAMRMDVVKELQLGETTRDVKVIVCGSYRPVERLKDLTCPVLCGNVISSSFITTPCLQWLRGSMLTSTTTKDWNCTV